MRKHNKWGIYTDGEKCPSTFATLDDWIIHYMIPTFIASKTHPDIIEVQFKKLIVPTPIQPFYPLLTKFVQPKTSKTSTQNIHKTISKRKKSICGIDIKDSCSEVVKKCKNETVAEKKYRKCDRCHYWISGENARQCQKHIAFGRQKYCSVHSKD